jgi:hypothetical protein
LTFCRWIGLDRERGEEEEEEEEDGTEGEDE